MESNQDALSWVRGLSAYLEFDGDEDSKRFVDFLEQCLYADNPVIDSTNQKGMVEFISVLRKFAPNPIFDIFHKYYRFGGDPSAIQDAFSRGQVLSKIWLVQELAKIKSEFEMIHVHAGWFGQIRLYLDRANISYNKMRIFDIDDNALEISDKVFNNNLLKDFKAKSARADITNLEWLYRTGCEYNINKDIKEKTVPDLVINTSAEHFKEDWYHKFSIRSQSTDPLFVIQSNNLFDVKEHVNCVHGIDEMLVKFPMSRVEYAGEKELFGYKRFMLIGRP
jgi:hypothetical protein